LRNLVGAEWDYRRRAIAPTSLPYLLRVDPTTACTAACPYCWRTNSPALPPAVLSVETLREAFGPLREVCLLASFQMFGEPTLNPALPEMVEHVHREGAATYVSTSLLVDDPDRLTRLLGSGLDLLTISLDAATPETYRRVKPGADLEVARRNTERLFEARRKVRRPPAIGFQVVVNRHNEPELPALRDLARRLGADYFDAKPALFLPDDSWVPRSPRYRIERLTRSRFACSMPWTSITLLSSGRYFPCCAFPGEVDLGPVGEPFPSIWNGEPLQAIRRGLRVRAPIAPCDRCPLGRLPRF
jgi:pyruvate-formate lyase-activating enzyme